MLQAAVHRLDPYLLKAINKHSFWDHAKTTPIDAATHAVTNLSRCRRLLTRTQ